MLETPDIIRQYIEQQTCWICGKGGWKALSQHLVKKHGLPASEVRELAYMFKRERLISGELSESMSEFALTRFGKRRHIPLRGVPSPKHILSTKAKDIARRKIREIRPLAGIAQSKRRKSHYCKVCGKIIETSKPQYCSTECVHIALSESAKKNMTPERIAFFNTIRQHPSPEEQSRRAKLNWARIKSLPIEQQRELYLRNARSRMKRVLKQCVICGEDFDVIPSQVGEIRTCRSKECESEIYRRRATGRKHTPEAIAKMSAYAKKRHINEPLFGRSL